MPYVLVWTKTDANWHKAARAHAQKVSFDKSELEKKIAKWWGFSSLAAINAASNHDVLLPHHPKLLKMQNLGFDKLTLDIAVRHRRLLFAKQPRHNVTGTQADDLPSNLGKQTFAGTPRQNCQAGANRMS
jgi:hypothetical protein